MSLTEPDAFVRRTKSRMVIAAIIGANAIAIACIVLYGAHYIIASVCFFTALVCLGVFRGGRRALQRDLAGRG